MAAILLLNQSRCDEGLVTNSYTVPTGGAGLYNVEVVATEIPPSGLSIVVNKNASPVFTVPLVTPTQELMKFKTNLSLADADAITVVLSSAVASDSLSNTVKSRMSIGQGYGS